MNEEFWNGVGGEKWVAERVMLDASLEPFGEALLDASELPERGAVVDVGCGCGATTRMIARRAPGLDVLGIDLSVAMLAEARIQAESEELSLRFQRADASTAALGDGKFQRIVSRFGVMFFADPPAAFTNMRQWLAPGGTLCVIVWGALRDNPWMNDLRRVLDRHIEVPRTSAGEPGAFSLAEPQDVDDILHKAGFVERRQVPTSLSMRVPGSVDDALRFYVDRSFVQTAIEQLNDDTRMAVMREVRDYIQARHDGSGMTLGASARIVRASAPR